MLFFVNDYCEGAHESILRRLMETNMEKLPGYGSDHYCQEAKEKIRKACECPQAEIQFLVGGTQTNAAVISSILKPYEGVIAAKTGHVNVHEAGAIERTGHKVLALPEENGKLKAETVKEYLETYYGDENYEHMVFPGMVYISHPTEYGTLYTTKELEVLLREADIITLHVPSTKETRGMMGMKQFKMMKSSGLLVNCSRGDICIEEELCAALEQGILAGAALDVYEMEPLPNDSRLINMQNVILSQHCAGLSEAAADRMALFAAQGIHEVLSGKQPTWPVNTLG